MKTTEAARRLHELAVREARGEATPEELNKLDRYQALLRYKPSAQERRMDAERSYHYDQAITLLKKLEYEAARSPNGADEPPTK